MEWCLDEIKNVNTVRFSVRKHLGFLFLLLVNDTIPVTTSLLPVRTAQTVSDLAAASGEPTLAGLRERVMDLSVALL